jgi:class 3 adenylate cyclase
MGQTIDAMPMAGPEPAAAVLFADVSGSTRLYQALGDSEAHRIVAQLLERLRQVIAAGGGRVVKTIGDEVMATFDDAADAVKAARAMQRDVARAVRSRELPAGIRVGLHAGPVLEEAGDVFGDTVNVAARMVSLAKVGQILTTGETLALLPARSRGETRHLDRARLHGRAEELDVFELLSGRDSVTSFSEIPAARATPPPSRLRVRWLDREAVVSRERPLLTIGRDPDNDLVLAFGEVSRRHARIEWRRGRCILVDESTNGTLVAPDRRLPRHVRRDQHALEGCGVIAAGFDPESHPERLLHYELLADSG